MKITQKKVDWERWIPGVHQLVAWLCTSTPSYNSQRKQELRIKGKKGGKGGKGKGGKGKNYAWKGASRKKGKR